MMTETITVAIIAGAAAYAGSVARGGRMKAPEATAQAYRDLLSAVTDLHRACVDLHMAETMNQPLDEARAAWNLAGGNVSNIANNAGFLIQLSDLDVVDSVNESYQLPSEERVMFSKRRSLASVTLPTRFSAAANKTRTD